MSPFLWAGLVLVCGFGVALWRGPIAIHRRNEAFNAVLEEPKGHVSSVFFEISLAQMEAHLPAAKAGGNVRHEWRGLGALTVTRKRDRSGLAGYSVRWDAFSKDPDLADRIGQHAPDAVWPSENKVEFAVRDDYLELETILEAIFAPIPEDDLNNVLTWRTEPRANPKGKTT